MDVQAGDVSLRVVRGDNCESTDLGQQEKKRWNREVEAQGMACPLE